MSEGSNPFGKDWGARSNEAEKAIEESVRGEMERAAKALEEFDDAMRKVYGSGFVAGDGAVIDPADGEKHSYVEVVRRRR